MPLELIGVIAEVVSAAAVVISLAYLALQIRSSAIIDKARTRTELTGVSQNILYHAAGHAELMLRAYSGEALTPGERFQLTLINRAVFRGFENYVYQRRYGLFDESEWGGIYRGMQRTLARPYVQEDWRAVRDQYSDALRETLDPLVADVTDQARATKLV